MAKGFTLSSLKKTSLVLFVPIVTIYKVLTLSIVLALISLITYKFVSTALSLSFGVEVP